MLTEVLEGNPGDTWLLLAWSTNAVLLILSVGLFASARLAPVWCHRLLQSVTILLWVMWAGASLWFIWCFVSPRLDQHSLRHVLAQNPGDLAPYSLAILGGFMAVYFLVDKIRGSSSEGRSPGR